MNRLKATMLCTFSLARGRIIGLVILEAIITAAMIWFDTFITARNAPDQPYHEAIHVFFGNDLPVLLFMFTYGLSFFEKHTSFCVSNSVSTKYRIISQSVYAGGLCLIAAVYDCISRQLIFDVKAFSSVEMLRFFVCGGYLNEIFILSAIFENVVFYAMIFSAGYLIGSIKYEKSGRYVLGTMALIAAILWGTVILGRFTWINPVAWIVGTIPAIMLDNSFTAFLLFTLTSAVMLLFAYRNVIPFKSKKTEVK